jgi:filamentous hemagglutinin
MHLPRIRGTQIGLRDPKLVDQIVSDMLANLFAFDEPRGQIAGFIDERATYYVCEGHHRVIAALEIFRETGDDRFVRLLLFWGRWTQCIRPPIYWRPLPSRRFWGKLRNWIGV